MKIAFIMSAPVLSPSNGVLSQALTWKKGLESCGHEVTLVNPFDVCEWRSFDAIHFFVFTEYMADYIDIMYRVNPNIVISPILDTTYSVSSIRSLSKWGNTNLRLSNKYHRLRLVKDKVARVLARSQFEANYFKYSFGFTDAQIRIVPLSFGDVDKFMNLEREPYCFHLSLLADERKNVRRLVIASKEYDFKLKLAGKLRNDDEKRKIDGFLKLSNNVEYLGFLSEEDMMIHYNKAKVFALPSVNEGVGLVALEAAVNGCDIVITNFGGPHEYYGEYAQQVNPNSVDSIGQAVRFYIDGNTCQPELRHHILNNYSLSATMNLLVNAYQGV